MSSANQKFMLDGFATVQAVRRTAPKRETPDNSTSRSSSNAERKAQAGRTTLPSRTQVLCYACGYEFIVTGRMGASVLCPKCRVFLVTQDRTLDGAEADRVQTIGTVTVASGAVLDAKVHIVSRRLRVAGDARHATAACQQLEIELGGQLELERVTFTDLIILENARCAFDSIVVCRNLEVQGELDAGIQAEDSVTVHPCACVRGEIATPRLICMDGARLLARLLIGAAAMVQKQRQELFGQRLKATSQPPGTRAKTDR